VPKEAVPAVVVGGVNPCGYGGVPTRKGCVCGRHTAGDRCERLTVPQKDIDNVTVSRLLFPWGEFLFGGGYEWDRGGRGRLVLGGTAYVCGSEALAMHLGQDSREQAHRGALSCWRCAWR
jgi:hypothetical protein